MPPIKFPLHWKPYDFQVPLWNYLYNGGKRAIAIWHRRAGKDLLGLHWIVSAALKEVGTYWYIYPTFTQAKMAVWDAMTLEGRTYLSYIPDELIEMSSSAKQTITLRNGSIIKFMGSDNPKSLRGAGIKGVIVSEYSVCKFESIKVLEPMIERADAWMLYLYTPSPDTRLTHDRELYERYKDDPSTFLDIKTVDETFDHEGNPLYDLSRLRTGNMTEEEIMREYYCDFEAYKYRRGTTDIDTKIFAEHVYRIEADEARFGFYPHDVNYKVNTYWDVGISDYTVIWFAQEREHDILVMDYYYNRGQTTEFYIGVLKQKAVYQYGINLLPWDMAKRDVITLETRLSAANRLAEKHCLPPFAIGGKHRKEELWDAGKEMLKSDSVIFNKNKVIKGLAGLKDFDIARLSKHRHSTLESDITAAFCYMAIHIKTKEQRTQEMKAFEEDLGRYRHEKMINDDSSLFKF